MRTACRWRVAGLARLDAGAVQYGRSGCVWLYAAIACSGMRPSVPGTKPCGKAREREREREREKNKMSETKTMGLRLPVQAAVDRTATGATLADGAERRRIEHNGNPHRGWNLAQRSHHRGHALYRRQGQILRIGRGARGVAVVLAENRANDQRPGQDHRSRQRPYGSSRAEAPGKQ